MSRKVHIVKPMLFPVAMHLCERWTIKKAECYRIDVFEFWCQKRLFRVSQTGRRSNQSILKEICPEYSLEGLKLNWSEVKVTQSGPILCDSMEYAVHGILQTRILEWVAFPFSRGSSQSRDQTLQADSLPAEPQGKSKNTGVGSLFLFQWIFSTQELNRGLLNFRWILHQLNYHGSHWSWSSSVLATWCREPTHWKRPWC